MKFLHIQKLCFYYFGYTFKPNESIFVRFFALLSWVSLLGCAICQFHFAVEHKTDINLVTDSLATVLTCILTLTKVIRTFVKRSKFYNIVFELEDMWLKAFLESVVAFIEILHWLTWDWPIFFTVTANKKYYLLIASSEDKPFLEKASKLENRLILLYFIAAVGAGASYNIVPIAKGIKEKITTGNATWALQYGSEFIYDATVSPNYEITFLWFCQATFMCVFGSVGIDGLFYGCAFNISAHFQVIQNKFLNFNFSNRNIETTDDLKQLVRYHQKMLLLCEEFNDLYSPMLFIQFLITAAQICVIAYQLTLPDQMIDAVATRAFFLVTICFQCFTYCGAGSQITSESFAVSIAVYRSRWYEASIGIQKFIGFVLTRAQKSVVCTSGFYVADMATFSNILSAAASYITILRSFQNKN